MGGPFMQGVVLLGIIYWYSKGMLSLINEYYRSEFHQKLKRAPPEQKMHQLQPQSYDLDDMEQLIKMESLKDMEMEENEYNMQGEQQWNTSAIDFKEKNKTLYKSCYRPSTKVEFLNILLQLLENYHHQLYLSFNYPICLINEKEKT